ncbi:MAG: 3-methyl-2-oxobutanoate dehydrogenase subunit VorB [Treponemataceae bacterium]
MSKILMKGNEAIAKAAVEAGCKHFFGYPITPQNEIPEYMARVLPAIGGSFVQAESEIAAINMVYGAAGAGVRCMTSSSSPGIALKQEGISYLTAAELPVVIVNMMRGGPGLGGIQPSQADYHMCVKGGGNGDYRTIVLAPASVQEAADMTAEAFDLADEYRNPVMILADGLIGQMVEPVFFDTKQKCTLKEKTWATTGTKELRKPNIINSLYISAEELENRNKELFAKYDIITQKEQKAELYKTDDAHIIFVAYGTTARICKNAIELLEQQGIKAGLFRPKTLWPFPQKILSTISGKIPLLVVEMSMGQMVEDVKVFANGKHKIDFYGRTGGVIPTPTEIANYAKKILEGK